MNRHRAQRRKGWRVLLPVHVRLSGRAVVIGLVLFGLFAGLVLATLLVLPFATERLTPILQAQIAQRLPPGMTLGLGEASLRVGRDGVALRLNDVVFDAPRTATSTLQANAAQVDMGLDLGALLRREVRADRVTLSGVRLTVPLEDGSDTASVSYDALASAAAATMRTLERAKASFAAQALELTDVTLALGDRVIENVSLALAREARGLVATIEQGERTARLAILDADGRLSLAVSTGAERFTVGRKVPREMTAALELDADILPAANGAGLGSTLALTLTGNGPDGKAYTLDLACALTGAACDSETSRFVYGDTALTLRGWLGWPSGHADLAGPPRFDLVSDDAVLAEVEGLDPLALDRVAASGTLLPDGRGVSLRAVRIAQGEMTAELAGTVVARGVTPGLDLDIAGDGLTHEHVKQLWPRFLAPNTRGWVLDHVTAGNLDDVAISIDAAPDLFANLQPGESVPDGTLSGRARLNGVAFDYLTGLPPILDAAGEFALVDNRFTVIATKGRSPASGADDIALNEAVFEVENVRAVPPRAAVTADVTMSATALYTLGGPLEGVVAALPRAMTGEGDATLDLAFPLGGDLASDDIDFALDATVRNGRLPDVYKDFALTDAALTVTADPVAFEVAGKAKLDGKPLDVALNGAREGGVAAFEARMTRDVPALARLGVDLTGFASGSADIVLTGDDPADGPRRVEADIAGLKLTVPGRGVVKPSGRAGRFSADLDVSDARVELRGLALRAGPLRASGGAVSTADTFRLNLTSVATLEGESASVEVTSTPSDTKVVVNAQTLDTRPIMTAFGEETGGGASEGRLTVVGRAARLLGHNGRALSDASFSLAFNNGTALSGRFRGRDSAGNSVAADLGPESGKRILRATTPDGGEALRFLDIYGRVSGGELGLEAALPTSGGAFGALSIWDFEVRDEASFQKVAQGKKADTSRLAFDRVRVPFSYAGGQLKVGEGYLRGPAAGASFTGRLDLTRDRMNLTGTFVPLYALNNIFSRVPLLGDLLGGRRREGLLGITFALDGPLDDPSLRVNPLSAIAPGIFRRIFEFAPNAG